MDAYDAVGRLEDDYRTFLGDPGRWVRGASAVFVAELGGRPVGVVALTLPGDEQFEAMRPPPSGVGFAFQLDLTDEAEERFPSPGEVPDEPPWFEDVFET